MSYNSASLSSQPPYEGGATSGNPGIVKQDRVYGTSTTTDSQTIFDIDAFISTGFDKPERANLESWGSGGGPNKVAYSNVPLAQIPAGNITTSNPSAMNDTFSPSLLQQQPPAISNSGGYPQEMQAISDGGGYTTAPVAQQPQQASGMMGYTPPLQQGQLQQTPFPSRGQSQAYPSQGQPQAYPSQGQPQAYPSQGQPQAYPSQGQPQAYPAQRVAPQYQQLSVQQQPYTMQPVANQPFRQPQQQPLSHAGNAYMMSPPILGSANAGNPFGGNAAYMGPQSQLAPQGNRIQGGAYMANGHPGYIAGTTSTPFHNASAVQSNPADQARTNQEWDPFGPGPSHVTTTGGSVAGVGATKSRKWDPFSEETQQAQPNDGTSSGVNDTWADIQDSQIWESGNNLSKGYSDSKSIEDEAEWSEDEDDLGESGDEDEVNISRNSVKQEQADFEMAMKLQREEEELATNDNLASPNRRSYLRDEDSSRADGEVLSRISRRTLMRKKWRQTYYIFDGPDVLLLYRSRDDFLYNPRGANIKKQIELKHSNTLTQLKRKRYKEYGMLWHFTLEEMTDYVPSVVAKFASHERRIIEELGNRIAEAIRDKRRVRANLNNGSYAMSKIPSQGSRGSTSPGSSRKHRGSYSSSTSGHDRDSRRSSVYNTRGDEQKYSKWGSLS